MRPSLLIGSAIIALLPVPAIAQAGDDVLVMRRSIAPAKERGGATEEMRPIDGANTSAPHWVVSGWLRGEAACTAEAMETRLRGCAFQGKQLEESSCPQPAPETSRIVEDRRSCTFSWTVVSEGAPQGPNCSAVRVPVTAVCSRADGEVVDESLCSGQPKPADKESFNAEGCTFGWVAGEWGNWSSTCSKDATRSRGVACVRSDGSTVEATKCSGTGARPAATEQAVVESDCSHVWVPTEWSTQEQSCGGEVTETRTYSCQRADGEPADASLCTGAPPETSRRVVNHDSCQHTWREGSWSDWSSTCSTSSRRTRSVVCTREDGSPGDSSKCDASSRPNDEETTEILTGCSAGWSAGEWVSGSACNAPVTRSRVVSCRRSDGLPLAEGACDPSKKPTATDTFHDYSGCTYQWEATAQTGWSSTCSDSATASQTVTCRRSDGELETDEAKCTGNRPPSQVTGSNYTGCPASWTYGAWSSWSSSCSPTAQRTRDVQCQQNRPSEIVPVGTEMCSDAERQPSSEQSAIYTQCQPNWDIGAWGWNGVADARSSSCSAAPVQTRTITCRKISSTGELETVPDGQCGTKDETQRTLNADYSGCSYSWSIGTWGSWDSTCSQTAKRTRTVECKRSDGLPSTDGMCTTPKPDTQETAPNVVDCGGILLNQGFENGLGSWSLATHPVNPTITNDSRVDASAANFRDGVVIQQTVPQDAGSYEVAFWCKGQGQVTVSLLSARGSASASSVCTGSWTRFSHTLNWTLAAGTSGYYLFRISSGTSSGVGSAQVSVTIDDVLLRKK